VFVHNFQAGLRLPCDEMVIKVLKLFEVYLHQLNPNAIVRMGLFTWASRSKGVKVSASAFAAAHRLHHQLKPVFARGVQNEAHYGCLNFTYRAELSMPIVVYKNKWPSDWTQWWFYHKVDAEEYLVSRCEEVRGNRAPDVRLKSSQQTALEAFARCTKNIFQLATW
jgi:Putative gypsy type transposon